MPKPINTPHDIISIRKQIPTDKPTLKEFLNTSLSSVQSKRQNLLFKAKPIKLHSIKYKIFTLKKASQSNHEALNNIPNKTIDIILATLEIEYETKSFALNIFLVSTGKAFNSHIRLPSAENVEDEGTAIPEKIIGIRASI